MKKLQVGIVGAGAAGLMAAITAAGQGAEVTLLERGDRVGRKILVTGNGKCNLGNQNLGIEHYYGKQPEWILRCLNRFSTRDTITFFNGLGMMIKEKNGYLYPLAEQASVVLDVLRNEVDALGISLITECKVNRIARDGRTGKISLSDGDRTYIFDRVILATGGKAAPKTGSDGSGWKLAKQMGHHIIPTVPALVQLRCREDYLKTVAGVRAEGMVSVRCQGKEVARERGEIQFTDYGISGIPVFQISRIVNYLLRERSEVEVVLDLLPDFDEKSYHALQEQRSLLVSERTMEEYFTGMLNKKLMTLFIKLAGGKPGGLIEESRKEVTRGVYDLCKEWHLHVTGSNPYDNAQVCAGGVDTAEVSDSMESRKMPGVYFAGEILDVDGKCGGYNLQWAWSSGYVAGSAAAGVENKGVSNGEYTANQK